MSTAIITIEKSGWELVVPSAGKGLISNSSSSIVYVFQDTSIPDSSIVNGHPIFPNGSLNVDLSAGVEALYARMNPYDIGKSGKIVFTASS